MANPPITWQEQLLERHGLAHAYLDHAQQWFDPLAKALAWHQKGAGRPVLVGLNGCQGSGKTTLCDYLCAELAANHGVSAVDLSLDDFYYTRPRRERLAHQIHPLLMTRGVPGTHDIALLQDTLDQLLDPGRCEPVPIPRFDKAADERRSRHEWDLVGPGLQLVLLEGWCLGARPQEAQALQVPVNELESQEDADGLWRQYVNRALACEFEPLHQRVSQWVMLRAPSFDCVSRWRLEQEEKLAAATAPDSSSRIMDNAEIDRFIQFFQRLTIHCLETLPGAVDHLYTLDEDRDITSYTGPVGKSQ